jgi:hypothetical protein
MSTLSSANRNITTSPFDITFTWNSDDFDVLLLSLDENMMLQLHLALHEILVGVYQVFLEYSKVTINT